MSTDLATACWGAFRSSDTAAWLADIGKDLGDRVQASEKQLPRIADAVKYGQSKAPQGHTLRDPDAYPVLQAELGRILRARRAELAVQKAVAGWLERIPLADDESEG